LFIRNGVLFENFLSTKEEINFTEKTVLPNIAIIEKTFGIKPLIVRISPKEAEEDIYWQCYPAHIKKYLK
jgi:hypothetical protein